MVGAAQEGLLTGRKSLALGRREVRCVEVGRVDLEVGVYFEDCGPFRDGKARSWISHQSGGGRAQVPVLQRIHQIDGPQVG